MATLNDTPLLKEIRSLLQQLLDQTSALERQDPQARKAMLITARNLYVTLETPMETIRRVVWTEVSHVASPRASASTYSGPCLPTRILC